MTPWVLRLIIANIIVFFVQYTRPEVTYWLAFVPNFVYALQHPWTIITYMFAHGSIGHIFWNMLGLFFFGPRVEARMGSKQFITLYLVSGVAGALLSFATPGFVVGASGALYGVMLAFARFWPRDQILIWGIFPVEARILVVIVARGSELSAPRREYGHPRTPTLERCGCTVSPPFTSLTPGGLPSGHTSSTAGSAQANTASATSMTTPLIGT